MHQAGINRRTAQSQKNQSHRRQGSPWPGKRRYPGRRRHQTKPDHLCVTQCNRQKSADCPPGRNPDKEKSRKLCRHLRLNLAVKRQITASPKSCRLLQGTITEKCSHSSLCSGNRCHLTQGQCLLRALPGSGGYRLYLPCLLLPERQRRR